MYAAAPDKMVMNIETGMGAMNQGYNGEIGWSDNPMTGAQLLDGDQLAGMKLQADFYAPLNYSKHFTAMETLEETDLQRSGGLQGQARQRGGQGVVPVLRQGRRTAARQRGRAGRTDG